MKPETKRTCFAAYAESVNDTEYNWVRDRRSTPWWSVAIVIGLIAGLGFSIGWGWPAFGQANRIRFSGWDSPDNARFIGHCVPGNCGERAVDFIAAINAASERRGIRTTLEQRLSTPAPYIHPDIFDCIDRPGFRVTEVWDAEWEGYPKCRVERNARTAPAPAPAVVPSPLPMPPPPEYENGQSPD